MNPVKNPLKVIAEIEELESKIASSGLAALD